MIKKSLMKALKENIVILRQFIGSMTEEEIKRRIKDYWTIYEHVEHLVLTQIMLLKRIELFINEEHPTIVPYIPEEKPHANTASKSIANLLEKFSVYREKQLALIRKANGHVWERTGTHDEYNKYGFEVLIRHILLHDSYHMCRIEDLWIMKELYIKELR